MFECYIVDDELHAIKVLKRHIDQTPGLKFGGSDTNPMDTWKKLSDGSIAPDLLFLDIDMPQISGIDLAQLIKNMTKIVFTTAYPDYAVTAFETDAVDYLLKPISYERFLKSITKAKANIAKRIDTARANEECYIKGDVKGKMIRIKFDEILYVEAKGNYVEITESQHKRAVYLPLKELEKKLPTDKFMRIHKSAIINLKHIMALETGQIVMEDAHRITIGPSYKDSILALINPMLITKRRS